MTKALNSLGAMALELVAAEVRMYEFLGRGLDRVLVKIENTARSEFGHYQAAAGPFGAWPELADSTKDDRAKQGFPENEPLLRSGELRDSLAHERDGLEGLVGSTSDIMPYQEFGTSRIPARPVLGPAAFRNKEAIQKLIGAAAVSGLIGMDEGAKLLGLTQAEASAFGAGQAEVHEDLGYGFTTKD